jgi:hypothetical protein
MALKHKRRILGLGWLAVVLVWLPVEDVGVAAALLLGGTGCLWVTLFLGKRRRHVWIGGLAGFATPATAALLMLFKTGLHAHGFSDFSGAQLWVAIRLTPYLAAAGLAVGVALDLVAARRNRGSFKERGLDRPG